ncbi:MAG: methyltransferase [Bacteroidetes bacterium]|nr:MAG: methyltransferase [Bacteroidota bacterium]
MYEKSRFPHKRYEKTLRFMNKHLSKEETILDIGVTNPFSDRLKMEGYTVFNTEGQDLDLDYKSVKSYDVQVVTALQILEHLVSPFPLLQELPGKKLIATVPLNLWFANAYRNGASGRDRHYHEFEDWQFDWLLEKSGWKILDREKWIAPTKQRGITAFLKRFTYRYYAVYAERAWV